MKIISQSTARSHRYLHLAYGSGSVLHVPRSLRASSMLNALTLILLGCSLTVLVFRKKVSRIWAFASLFAMLSGTVAFYILFFRA